MKVFILRWNPKISSYKMKEHRFLCKRVHKADRFLNWSIYDWKKMKPGDAAVLCQVGTKNDGITLLGKFLNKPYEDDSWRNDGTIIHYADILILTAFMQGKKTLLSAKSLEQKFPEIDWHGGHSGICLDQKTGNKLVSIIDEELKKNKKLPDLDFSYFLKNDNRFLPINIQEKKEEILRILSPYQPIVHTCKEENYCDWLTDDEFVIDVPNSAKKVMKIVFNNWYINLHWAKCTRFFNTTNNDYVIFLDCLRGLLENKYCVLTLLQPKKMRENQKNQTYRVISQTISTTTLTKNSDKKEFYKELLITKNKFPKSYKFKATYWNSSRSFVTDIKK